MSGADVTTSTGLRATLSCFQGDYSSDAFLDSLPTGEPNELVEYVSQDSMHQIIDEWDRYDKDQDGSITIDEFEKGERDWYKSVNAGKKVSEEELSEKTTFWLRTLDKDKNGDVGWWEFANAKALLMLDSSCDLHFTLTREEVEAALEAFKSIDTSGDGRIIESEARQYYTRKYDTDVKNNMRTQKNATQEVETSVRQLFLSHDIDGDGDVGFNEFLKEEASSIIADRGAPDSKKTQTKSSVAPAQASHDGVAQILTQSQKDHAELKFNEMDVDKSGSIEYKEVTACFKALGIPMKKSEFKKKLKEAWGTIDKDGNESLDLEEFQSLYNFLYISSMDLSCFD